MTSSASRLLPPIYVADEASLLRARQLASDLQLDLIEDLSCLDRAQYVLSVSSEGLTLLPAGGKGGGVRVDFASGAVAHRRHFGGGKGQMIAKAVGFSKGAVPSVLDATAGLGKDAFVLATLGCKMKLFERSVVVAELLADGIARALSEGDGELQEIVRRMSLQRGDAIEAMTQATTPLADVVYLDPMYPASKKSAAVKKEMQAFQQIVGKDLDGEALLLAGLNAAEYRVVVKRPRKGETLPGVEPGYQLMGKSSRFDIYPIKAFKS
ncbi:16S rRNA (guanine1516-N2)-methyltransferase [Sinobacterium caligoides]|uniref:Ribosomal RNA small subunit methyltransferase J n=1 Tax=Sinobacterium caligoides TaxID=933926 RepID=A0A3N2E022_9GAMM|nr:class I SAM-dependent methyltransferase [Sinobacterium caligoides]ROS04925.1 16S rRNA (guanine1516-N2)-methyltransferase [Sinobacterium caligoides]